MPLSFAIHDAESSIQVLTSTLVLFWNLEVILSSVICFSAHPHWRTEPIAGFAVMFLSVYSRKPLAFFCATFQVCLCLISSDQNRMSFDIPFSNPMLSFQPLVTQTLLFCTPLWPLQPNHWHPAKNSCFCVTIEFFGNYISLPLCCVIVTW